MNSNEKTFLEIIAISFLFLSLAIGLLLVIEKAFPEELDGITGRTITQVYVLPPIPENCNTTVHPGWNLISFFCITSYEDMDLFLANLTKYDYTAVYTYRHSDATDPWKVYKPGLPSWVIHDLEYFSRIDAYWIYFNITDSSNFFLNGSKRIPTNIPLYPGWNLVGYPTNINRTINDSFYSINDSLLQVFTFNNSMKFYLNYTKGGNGTLNITKPYQGYWMLVNDSEIWRVNW